jgi:NTE family protein
MKTETPDFSSPVTVIETDKARAGPEDGMALCLSGGGYRAMLFHLGALWRLNEVGYLPSVRRISSVSGGSISAGMLGLNWSRLAFDDNGVSRRFESAVVFPVRSLAGRTIDLPAIIGGILLPGSISDRLVAAYRRHLFGNSTLQDLPDDPRFVINATNVQSGALWRFMKPYMRDYRVGEVRSPRIELALAVAASSAFPPVLSPVRLKLSASDFSPPGPGEDLHMEPYTTNVILTDGGVYDNLGLETAWKRYNTILVSDGGSGIRAEPAPKHDWPRHALRVYDLVDNQVRSLRKRQVIDSLKIGKRKGAYWGIGSDIADYQLPDSLPCPVEKTGALAAIATRLSKVESGLQERLINWGYAVCDAALRRYQNPALPAPKGFPYPAQAFIRLPFSS